MPYVNLIVAQMASGWIAAPYLVTTAQSALEGITERYAIHIMAVVAAVIILIAGHVGSRISGTIAKPTVSTAAMTLAGALTGSMVSAIVIAPRMEYSMVMSELYTLVPVAFAILGYLAGRGAVQQAA